MSIRSMTGFSTADAESAGWTVSCECRSVNHKGLDTRIYLPRECSWFESDVASMIRERIHRGRIEVRVELSFDAESDDLDVEIIDAARFHAVCQQLRDVSQTSATGPVTLANVLEFKEVFQKTQVAEIDEDNPALAQAVETALDGLVDAREEEGEGIASNLRGHIDDLATNLEELEAILPEELEAFRGRLRDRIEDAVEEFAEGEVDEERLAQEFAYYADKSDVSEELQRAKSHIAKLREILGGGMGDEAVGKKIDFYLQELIRETNTMGSKSQSSRGTDLVIAMKSSVEKMREQAANIE